MLAHSTLLGRRIVVGKQVCVCVLQCKRLCVLKGRL